MLSYMASGFFYAAQASEPTRIKIGLAGATPNQSVQGLNISTAQIDEVLNDFGGPLGIGNNYTTNLANGLFSDFVQIQRDLSNELKEELLKVKEIKSVYSVNVTANPAQLVLSQDGTRIGTRIGFFDARLDTKIGSPCGNLRVDGMIEDINLKGEYDVYTGQLIFSDGDLEITKLKIRGTNVFSSICKTFVDGLATTFAGGGIKYQAKKAVREALDDAVGSVVIDDLFSLKKFLDSSEMFIETIESPSFSYAGYSLPPVPASARQDAAEAIRQVNNMLESPTLQGTGLRFTLDIVDGSSSNLLSLIVSHAPTKLSNIEMRDECGTTNVSFGDRTERADIYWRPSSYGGWIKKSTTYWNGSYNLGKLQDGSQFIAIGKSSLFGNLYSKPESRNIVTYRRDRNRPRPIYDTFCGGFLDDGDLPDFPNFPAFP